MCQDAITNRIEKSESLIISRVENMITSLQRFIDSRMEEQGDRIDAQAEVIGEIREKMGGLTRVSEIHEKRLDRLNGNAMVPHRKTDPPDADYRGTRDTTEMVFTIKGKTALKVAIGIVGLLVFLAALAGPKVFEHTPPQLVPPSITSPAH